MTSLANALFGKSQQKILGTLFANPARSLHMRELARQASVTPSTLQRDLKTLVDAGILTRTARGPLQLFQANQGCPIFSELRGIATKTFGIADQIKDALQDLDIELAFIFGSVAKGAERNQSDVDVFVIGTDSYHEVLNRMRPVEELIGREINVKFYKPEEFSNAYADGNAFLHRVVNDEKIFLKGSEVALRSYLKYSKQELAELLEKAFKGVKGIERAFVFGSEARGEAKSDSDLDIIVIGNCLKRDVMDASYEALLKLGGREVNALTYTHDDWKELIADQNAFATEVEAGPRIEFLGEKCG